MVNRLAGGLLDALFPQYCRLCGLPGRGALPLCAGCRGDLLRNTPCCARCALPLPRTVGLCGACLRAPPPFARVLAPWVYEEQLAYLVGRWKYAGERRLTPLLASLWLEACGKPPAVDYLVPVPLHWRRYLGRGFNQSEELARQLLARGVDARLATGLVRRVRPTRPQQGLAAGPRRHNLRGVFTVRRPCDNLRLAVIDDVLTTGATAAAVATALAESGAAHVQVWCLARTPAPAS